MCWIILLFSMMDVALSKSCSCQAGFGLISPCDENNGNSTCVPCEAGHTFSDGTTECQMCSRCSSIEKHSCNVTHNSVCVKCDRGFYWDSQKCRQCSLCPHGTGANVPCGVKGDTECHVCPVGYFSDVLSHSADCTHCSTCKENQILLLNCTSIHDTICTEKGTYLRSYRRPSTQLTDLDSQLPSSAPLGRDLLPLYCALLGAVVFGLLVYVLIKNRRSSDSKKLIRHEERFCCNALVDGRISDVTASKKMQLETLLNARTSDQKDWRGLARQLGYGTSLVNYLQGTKTKHQVRHLLVQLDKDGVRVSQLVEALLIIGRADAAYVLNHSRVPCGDIV